MYMYCTVENNLGIHKSGVPRFLVITNASRFMSTIKSTKAAHLIICHYYD